MIAVIQRVSSASVVIQDKVNANVQQGLLILLGIEEADNDEDILWLTAKITNLRIFDDGSGMMNKSVKEIGGEALVVSQFTLHASTRKGNRPSYIKAAKPDIAIPVYEKFIQTLEQNMERSVQTGVFGADMKVTLVNDGPVTIIIDTKNKV
ncbi:MAG TPA: D-aminoacyl-tRNA deacylase [Ohtaekwangia sp.]|nr:D-aminoacyl-tRNA deacylase [Ohtaekwangia sp.]